MAEFVMPILGADMRAGTLLTWRKQAGETVRRGDIIAEVETDKADVEVEVFTSGIIERLLVEPGTEVPVGTPLAIIKEEGAGVTPVAPMPPAPVRAAGVAAAPAPSVRSGAIPRPALPRVPAAGRPPISPAARRLAAERGVDLATVAGTGPGGRIQLRDVEQAAAAAARAPTPAPTRVSPLARQLAAQLGVDLTTVQGSGPEGRITRRDIEQAAAAPAVPSRPAAPPVDRQARMRQAIAAAMDRSNREIPQFQLQATIDMSRAFAWLAAENEKRSVATRLLYGVLLIKAVALALREVPELNASWVEGAVVLKPDIHVGVAIALRGGGLVAPALHDTAGKSLDELMRGFRDLVQRARAWSLRSSELSDPTITVTSLGEQGVETVFGLVFPPQAAIVGFGKIVERPWSVDGQIVSRPLLSATLSADHRVTDGHRGSLFLAAIDRFLQEPEKL